MAKGEGSLTEDLVFFLPYYHSHLGAVMEVWDVLQRVTTSGIGLLSPK